MRRRSELSSSGSGAASFLMALMSFVMVRLHPCD
jgi:hypothetical protein